MEDFEMKRIYFSIFVFLVLLFSGFTHIVYSQESTKDTGQLSIPWDEFKKLLNLDEEDIVIPMETFQKLLEQTGVRSAPPHQVQGGNVILTRTEFKKLVDNMIPPGGPLVKPPFDYLITKAAYSGKLYKNHTSFQGNFNVHVLKEDAYLKIPLLPQSIALDDIKVDGNRALVVSENGYHHVVIAGAGEYDVSASFSVKSSLEKGPHKVDLAIQQTPITLLNLEIPLKDITVDIPQSQQVITSSKGNSTLVSAVIAPGRNISVLWGKQVAAAEKLPAKLYSEIYHLVSIEDDAFKINSDINYNILHNEVDAVQLSIPQGMNILNVFGEGVGEWQEIDREEQRILYIPFNYRKKGPTTIKITTEIPLSETGLANAFGGIQTLETVRETGLIGVELNTSAEIIISGEQGLEKIAVQKLPALLTNKSAKPLIMGFKYLKHPFELVLDVKKHEKIAVPMATINSANVVTLFTEDGKIVHRLIYQVKNNAKQFLALQLPEASDVWSVFVNNQPVEASMNKERKLLVPLIRSQSVNNRLNTFPVEVIFAMSENRFDWLGSRSSTLPVADLLISQLMWSVYLPNDYSYAYFSSTLEKEEMIRGVNLFSGAKRQYNEQMTRGQIDEKTVSPESITSDKLEQVYEGKKAKSSFKNIPMEEQEVNRQMAAELNFGGRLDDLAEQDAQAPSGAGYSVGVLPIQIRIPTSGQLYRFAKTIIKPEDPLTLSVNYSQLWVVSLVKWLIFAIIVLIIFLIRKRLYNYWTGLKSKLDPVVKWFSSHEDAFQRFSQSIMMTIVLFGCMIVFWPISGFLGTFFFILFLVSVVYQIANFIKKRSQPKPEPITIVDEDSKKKGEDQ
jgi:hypothetical protein